VAVVTRPLAPLVVTGLVTQLVVARQLMLAQPDITKLVHSREKEIISNNHIFLYFYQHINI
jgi:hypothetical protein